MSQRGNFAPLEPSFGSSPCLGLKPMSQRGNFAPLEPSFGSSPCLGSLPIFRPPGADKATPEFRAALIATSDRESENRDSPCLADQRMRVFVSVPEGSNNKTNSLLGRSR